jgi:hypothetical protein
MLLASTGSIATNWPAQPSSLLLQYNKLIADMLSVYNGATTCAYNEPFKCGLRLEPGKSTAVIMSPTADEPGFATRNLYRVPLYSFIASAFYRLIGGTGSACNYRKP